MILVESPFKVLKSMWNRFLYWKILRMQKYMLSQNLQKVTKEGHLIGYAGAW